MPKSAASKILTVTEWALPVAFFTAGFQALAVWAKSAVEPRFLIFKVIIKRECHSAASIASTLTRSTRTLARATQGLLSQSWGGLEYSSCHIT